MYSSKLFRSITQDITVFAQAVCACCVTPLSVALAALVSAATAILLPYSRFLPGLGSAAATGA